jgi:uncharacterized protein (DUF1501 family)
MRITRRSFLRGSAVTGLVSLSGAPPAFLCRAAIAGGPSSREIEGRILVILQLEGGNDGLNTVIPYNDDEYHKARPGIGVGRQAVLRLDDYHGLHPQLAGFKELYDAGALAIIQGVGYPHQDRSHFRSMDIWQSASLEAVAPDRGWIGRALDLNTASSAPEAPALAVGVQRLPLALTSADVNVPTIADVESFRLNLGGDGDSQRIRRELMQRLAQPGADSHGELLLLQRAAASAYRTAETLAEVTRDARAAAAYPGTRLAQQLKLVSQLIRGELGARIFFTSLGGFDTHSQQQGAHQGLLAELAGAVAAFYADLKEHKLDQQVALATYSEFGRRVKENGSLGTDHGAASQMFVVIPGKGGIVGAHPSLTDLDDGDLKFHTDFRSVYATLLEKWLGYAAEPVLAERFTMLDFV